jgi:hypothetical protein
MSIPGGEKGEVEIGQRLAAAAEGLLRDRVAVIIIDLLSLGWELDGKQGCVWCHNVATLDSDVDHFLSPLVQSEPMGVPSEPMVSTCANLKREGACDYKPAKLLCQISFSPGATAAYWADRARANNPRGT